MSPRVVLLDCDYFLYFSLSFYHLFEFLEPFKRNIRGVSLVKIDKIYFLMILAGSHFGSVNLSYARL